MFRWSVAAFCLLVFAAPARAATPVTTFPDGLVGEFYPAASGKGPLVLVLGGPKGASAVATSRWT